MSAARPIALRTGTGMRLSIGHARRDRGQREPAAKRFWRKWRRPPGGKSSSVPQNLVAAAPVEGQRGVSERVEVGADAGVDLGGLMFRGGEQLLAVAPPAVGVVDPQTFDQQPLPRDVAARPPTTRPSSSSR